MVVIDASNSTYDSLKWKVNNESQTDCNNEDACALTLSTPGTYVVQVTAEVASSSLMGLSNSPSTKDQGSITIIVRSYLAMLVGTYQLVSSTTSGVITTTSNTYSGVLLIGTAGVTKSTKTINSTATVKEFTIASVTALDFKTDGTTCTDSPKYTIINKLLTITSTDLCYFNATEVWKKVK